MTMVPYTYEGVAMATRGDDVDELKSGGRMPRLQFHAKAKSYGDTHVPPGHYAIVTGKDAAESLGGEVDVLPLACRVKALDVRNRAKPVEYFDSGNELYQEVKRMSNEKNSGCMWGPEFLLLERTTGKLYTMYWGAKSARMEYDHVRPYLPLTPAEAEKAGAEPHPPSPCTLGHRMSTGEYTYAIPDVKPCKREFSDAPANDEVNRAMSAFLNVSDAVTAAADDDDPR